MTLPAPKERAHAIVEVRDLVRMDMALHGARFIIVEFASATAFVAAIGIFVLFAGTPKDSLSVLLAGCFFYSCALNALTFLLLALSIVRRGDRAQRGEYDRRVMRIYGLWALGLLLVPLVFPLFAIYQRS